MTVTEHSERLMIAADAYARAFAEYGYGPEGDLKRNALKEAIRAVAADHQGAVNEALRLECALEQVRSRFNESDMQGVRETLDSALNHAGGR
jgi:hypothetical protein